MEPSLTNPDTLVVLCQYMTLSSDGFVTLNEVTYMGGESCANPVGLPLWMQTIYAEIVSTTETVITVPLSDDTRSDILGIYTAAPNGATFGR